MLHVTLYSGRFLLLKAIELKEQNTIKLSGMGNSSDMKNLCLRPNICWGVSNLKVFKTTINGQISPKINIKNKPFEKSGSTTAGMLMFLCILHSKAFERLQMILSSHSTSTITIVDPSSSPAKSLVNGFYKSAKDKRVAIPQ